MKPIRLIPILLFTACAAHTPGTRIGASTTQPIGHSISAATLRTPERLKEYRFGRYVDPRDLLVMHESHPVYRIETNAGWNLTPGSTPVTSAHPTIVSTTAAHDALFAEINKQRAAARALADETAVTNQHLAQLSKILANGPNLADQITAFQKEIDGIKEHLDTLDDQVREDRPSVPNAAIPTPDKW
jgi:hypothetical protein